MPSIRPWAAEGQSGQGKGLPWASSRSNSAQVYISIVRIMMLRSASDKVLKNLPRIDPFIRSSVVRSQTAVVPPSTINSTPLT